MRVIRIILVILFCVVIGRGIGLLAAEQNGTAYPVAAITGGMAGCLVLFVRRRR